MSPLPLRLLAALAATLILSPLAQAGVYKCYVDGKLVYSDQKCAADSAPMSTNPDMNSARSNRPAPTSPYRGNRYREAERTADSSKGSGATVIGAGDDDAKKRCDALKRWKAEAKSRGNYRGKTLSELEDMEFSLCYGRVNKAQ
ncbi:MAG: DUF4124 domain-containing protein [Rhodocyclaceae bacterium]|nr:DUF4124 domain-containing protein [Rhodocyclaceae bacterium]